MTPVPGPIVLLGSGETSPNIRKVYDELFRTRIAPIEVSILETPAGFEPNSDHVAGQIGIYLERHLQNYRPAISIIPARKRGTAYSPDDPSLLTPLFKADFAFIGPGSPTYAARQLQGSVAWQTVQACQRLGAGIIFASASTIASSKHALPVYEIYKVGEDLHWQQGLDFFGAYGLNLIFVPHWNNNDGGEELDTSHCYIGTPRYEELLDLLPSADSEERTIVGIDENTALIVDPSEARCDVRGAGNVRVIRQGTERHFPTGSSFDVSELGPFQLPTDHTGLDQQLWDNVIERVRAQKEASQGQPPVPDAVLTLVNARESARQQRDWTQADQLRDQIESMGWNLMDTAEGPVVEARGTR